VDARGQCRIQALGQAQCDRVALWDDWGFGWVRLESLHDAHVSHAYTQRRREGFPDLEQPCEEGNIVGPFLLGTVPEGECALDAGSISSKAFVFFIESWRGLSACVALFLLVLVLLSLLSF
jgi:hypothetical protein